MPKGVYDRPRNPRPVRPDFSISKPKRQETAAQRHRSIVAEVASAHRDLANHACPNCHSALEGDMCSCGFKLIVLPPQVIPSQRPTFNRKPSIQSPYNRRK